LQRSQLGLSDIESARQLYDLLVQGLTGLVVARVEVFFARVTNHLPQIANFFRSWAGAPTAVVSWGVSFAALAASSAASFWSR